MAHRTSYSQNSTYISCPKHWYNKYVEKWQPEKEGASIYFGSAIDVAIMSLLKGEIDYKEKFEARWEYAVQNGIGKKLFDDKDIIYSHADFDEYVLEPEDFLKMEKWIKELELEYLTLDPINCYKKTSKIKKNPFVRITEHELKYFNRCSWISLKRKGLILIESFVKDFYPKITKVISTQKYGKITDPSSGDSISGFIDMVLEIEGYPKPIIFDLKTAGKQYKEENIELTEQLTLYAAFEAATVNTNLVGYVVLCKNINKESVDFCINCGSIKESRHQTCNNVLEGKRCGGKWKVKKLLKPEVQVLVKEKSQEQINNLLQDVENIVLAMKNNIVYKNTDKCNNWFGSSCPYYQLCHKNKTDGLTKK